ncbi:uncharacterized protein LOC131845010 [Achroia grisella]|uniref:uncharacterized protein LOC131845010 n=1 Tax=Achroia grisella TaxID=688607 RepID=UPI0027D30B67|nr:uncharacterized protein LOC131845010 [Achroia grisella]
MDNPKDEDSGQYSGVIKALINMFGTVSSREMIVDVVENCGGDINLAVEGMMNITSGINNQSTTPNTSLVVNDVTPKDVSISTNNESNSTSSLINIPVTTVVGETTIAENKRIIQNTDMSHNLKNIKGHSSMKALSSPVHNTNELASVTQEESVRSLISNNTNSSCSRGSMSHTGAVRKRLKPQNSTFWTDQLRRLLNNHNAGNRILIIMRGAPGSGKTYLAKQVIENIIGSTPGLFETHVFSTDDYFNVRGIYQFNRSNLSNAHAWNQNRARYASEKGLSPIIIDNTNIEDWEMEPYFRIAVAYGYIVEIMEPSTTWSKKPSQLVKRNSHNVPLLTIQRMLDNYQNFTPDLLFRRFKLSYPANMKPPVLRNIPSIEHVSSSDSKNSCSTSVKTNMKTTTMLKNTIETVQAGCSNKSADILLNEVNNSPICNPEVDGNLSNIPTNNIREIVDHRNDDDTKHQMFCYEMGKQQEEIEKVEREWENGEAWDDSSKPNISTTVTEAETITSSHPKPQRWNSANNIVSDERILKTVNDGNDWSKMSMFLSPWNENIPANLDTIEVSTETRSSGTCIESGDSSNEKNQFKVLTTTSRDINLYHISPIKNKIPQVCKLDKSSMTNDQILMESYRCEYEEKHFNAFRKMFRKLPRAALRDIFDKCQGDVNWAVGIVIDDIENNRLHLLDSEELSDTDDSVDECGCMAAYNIIPDTKMPNLISTNVPQDTTSVDTQKQRKVKKAIANSDTSLQLKRQIEQNVVISDNHYSDHCLRIRKIRRGELNYADNLETTAEESEGAQASSVTEYESNSSPDGAGNGEYSDDDDDSSSTEEPEKCINMYLGREFITQLDELFGRKDMTYPDNVVPKISMPQSLLNQINALWMESLMHQFDENEKQSELQDKEFARELAMKVNELAAAGEEPVVPDFKEIMDMDFAMSLYQKDVAEWRNKEPSDMAARMSREKLYNLFPEISQELLSELLMAHDNNFQATVEGLLISTGKSEIVEEKNGISKFVMQKEMERQEKVLEEERKAIAQVEWPLLPAVDNVDMNVINNYRQDAEKHLSSRNLNYQKAQEYIRRGMTQVANYYSDVAAFHKLKFEHSNSLAAASLMQFHAANNPNNATVDLHYLRVSEAKESLDLFLDVHINKMKENHVKKQGPKYHALYIITGRGLHSKGMPRIKPAVKRRLRERNLHFGECNPGLLTANVSANDKLTFEIQTP